MDDSFHVYVYDTLLNHIKDGLTPPITTKEQMKELKKNIKKLVLNSNLHVFDSGDTIWKKLASNKHKFPYFNSINFITE